MRDFQQMNALTDKYGADLAVIGFPTNQFGHQTNEKEFEILSTLKYVRPGGGYEPNFTMMGKLDVNGENAHPLFQYLRTALPTTYDDLNGLGDDFIISLASKVLWAPLSRTDIGWNFEKFLINQNGVPVRRYSPKFPTEDVAADIDTLLKDGPDALSVGSPVSASA